MARSLHSGAESSTVQSVTTQRCWERVLNWILSQDYLRVYRTLYGEVPQHSPKGNYDKGSRSTILKSSLDGQGLPKMLCFHHHQPSPELTTLPSLLVCPKPSKNLQLGIAPKDPGNITMGGHVSICPSLLPVAAKNHSDQKQFGRGKPLFGLYFQATVHH